MTQKNSLVCFKPTDSMAEDDTGQNVVYYVLADEVLPQTVNADDRKPCAEILPTENVQFLLEDRDLIGSEVDDPFSFSQFSAPNTFELDPDELNESVFDRVAYEAINGSATAGSDQPSVETRTRQRPAPHLRDHMYSLSSDIDYFACRVCDYKDVSKHGLNLHVRKHLRSAKEPFRCCHCSYTAARRQHVKQHEATHFKDKPYRCRLCDYSASQKQSLVAHTRKHYSWKPFKCHLCDYSALRKQHLVVHMHKHLTKKPYKCDICDFSTSWKEYLAVHKKRHPESKTFKPWSE